MIHINESTVAELTLTEQEFDESVDFLNGWWVWSTSCQVCQVIYVFSEAKRSFLLVDAVALTPSKTHVLFLKGGMEAKTRSLACTNLVKSLKVLLNFQKMLAKFTVWFSNYLFIYLTFFFFPPKIDLQHVQSSVQSSRTRLSVCMCFQ